MKTKTMDGVVAIAVFVVTANGMPHVGRVDAYLILTTRLKLKLHKAEVGGPVEDMVVGYGIFTTIVHRGGIGDVGLVVLKPVGDGALVLLHLA